VVGNRPNRTRNLRKMFAPCFSFFVSIFCRRDARNPAIMAPILELTAQSEEL
jgi:hypothetical protein